jgi:hypothetical protein
VRVPHESRDCRSDPGQGGPSGRASPSHRPSPYERSAPRPSTSRSSRSRGARRRRAVQEPDLLRLVGQAVYWRVAVVLLDGVICCWGDARWGWGYSGCPPRCDRAKGCRRIRGDHCRRMGSRDVRGGHAYPVGGALLVGLIGFRCVPAAAAGLFTVRLAETRRQERVLTVTALTRAMVSGLVAGSLALGCRSVLPCCWFGSTRWPVLRIARRRRRCCRGLPGHPRSSQPRPCSHPMRRPPVSCWGRSSAVC